MRNKKMKFGYLAKNTFLFTISSFGTKILTFLVVPLYTSRLSTSDFGKVDLLSTTVSFLIPVLTINIASAVMRFSIDNPIKAGSKFKYGATLIAVSSLILLCGLEICYWLKLIPWNGYYYVFLFLLFVFEAYETLFVQFLRGIGKVSVMVVSSMISTFVRIFLNIVTLVFLNWGVYGYLVSMVTGSACSILYSSVIIRPFFVIRNEELSLKDPLYKEMNAYGFMEGINAIGWIIVASLDKYILTWLEGASENGIYSVSYKIPTIITALCAVFTQAWSLSAIREYKKDDEDGFFTKTYEMYNVGLVICCSILILLNIPLSKFMYSNDFFEAWRYTPTLVLAMVFSGLSSFLASTFTAVKRNGILAISTFTSAIINAILNFILIPRIGALGAAIATAISFYLVYIIRFFGSRRYIKYRVNYIRDSIIYIIIIFQIILAQNATEYWYIQLLIVLIIIVCYWKTIKYMALGLFSMAESKAKGKEK